MDNASRLRRWLLARRSKRHPADDSNADCPWERFLRSAEGTKFAKSPLSPRKLALLAPFVVQQLRELALAGTKSPPAAIKALFVQLYGEGRSRGEELQFLCLTAPLARQAAIEICPPSEPFGRSDITVQDLKVTLAWLSTMDRQSLMIFDLRYFGGLSIRDISMVLGMRHDTVLRALRFVKGIFVAR